MRGPMVKSSRYDQKSCEDSAIVSACRVRCTGYADTGAYFYGYPASDRDAAPNGYADARVDLPAAESCSEVGAA